jgi:hypothetical protein
MLPIEATDPTLPIERNDPCEARDSAESRDHSDSQDRELTSPSVAPAGPDGDPPGRGVPAGRATGHRDRPVPVARETADGRGMSIHAVAEDRQATSDAQVIAELAAGALESIARIHAAGLAEVVDIAENPAAVRDEPQAEEVVEVRAETPVQAESPVEAETPVQVEAETPVQVEAEATEEEPVTAEFATPAGADVVQPVEALRAVPQATRGRHLSEAETTEFAAQRAA